MMIGTSRGEIRPDGRVVTQDFDVGGKPIGDPVVLGEGDSRRIRISQLGGHLSVIDVGMGATEIGAEEVKA